MTSQKDRLLIPLSGYPDEIGLWLSALQDARARTLRVIQKIEPHWLDFVPSDNSESVSTILYHLAAIEASWLYEEILQLPFPPEVEELLPHDVRDETGKLTSVSALLPEHLQRLEKVRGRLLHAFFNMPDESFTEIRNLPDYDISPVYVLHHLMQHEAEHRSQIDAIALKAKSSLGTSLPEEKL